MPGELEKEDDKLFLPPWETEDQADLEPPPRPSRVRQPAVESDYGHPLLQPLAQAQEALTRLETRVEAASEAVAGGLRARLSYREACGWLAHAHVSIHPHDLALRDRGLTGSYGAAFSKGRLKREIPATTAQGTDFEMPPSDILVDQALRLARLWRRLAELRTWRPLANTAAVRETLQSLGCSALTNADIDDWTALIDRDRTPLLIRAGRAARDWMNRCITAPNDPGGMFLAACLWRAKGAPRPIPLPFWSAPEIHHNRLGLHAGLPWMADFLACITAAAKIGLDELERLQRAGDKSRSLGRTTRSHLTAAADAVLRAPVVTARDLAETLKITPRAALGLLRQLVDAGVIREATGRAAWRAFVSN